MSTWHPVTAGGDAAASKKLRLAVVDGMYGTARRVESTPASELGGSSKATTLQASGSVSRATMHTSRRTLE